MVLGQTVCCLTDEYGVHGLPYHHHLYLVVLGICMGAEHACIVELHFVLHKQASLSFKHGTAQDAQCEINTGNHCHQRNGQNAVAYAFGPFLVHLLLLVELQYKCHAQGGA